MKLFVVVPCNWGEDFEDCHFVVANNRQEALAVLNINEKGEHRTNWFKRPFVNVYCLNDFELNNYMLPCEINPDLVSSDEPTAISNEEAEQKLRQRLQSAKIAFQKCREDAERFGRSAGAELDDAISRQISEAGKKAIQELINHK